MKLNEFNPNLAPLYAVGDDYEHYDTIISTVQSWGLKSGLHFTPNEVQVLLLRAMNRGLVKAYTFPGASATPVEVDPEGRLIRELFFYPSEKGLRLLKRLGPRIPPSWQE